VSMATSYCRKRKESNGSGCGLLFYEDVYIGTLLVYLTGIYDITM